jgi:glycosyltransferase involved in cell wall biosynthesis
MSFEKRNLLFVIQNDLLGGAEQLMKSLATEYDSNGNSVHIIIMRTPMKRNWDNKSDSIQVQYLNTKTYFPGIIKLAWFIIWFTKKRDFDYTFSSNININALLGLLYKFNLLKTKKLIIRETTSVFLRIKGLKKQFYILLYKLGYSSANLIICQTDVMKHQFLDNLCSSHKWKMKTIQNPIDINKIITNSSLPFEGFLPEKNRKYIVSAGRFIHEKGFDLLIQSFKELNHLIPDYDLLILGEGKLRSQYERMVEDLALYNRVFLPGFIQNPIPYFKMANICIVSSRTEGFPNVLLQMAAVNDNVISTLCSGNIDLIPCIYLCESNNREVITKILSKVINERLPNMEIKKKTDYLLKNNFQNYISTINFELK